MPDWFAHIMLAVIVATCLRITGAKRVLFIIGNVMPDFVRFLIIIGNALDLQTFNVLVSGPINSGSHTLLGVFAYALFISIFFDRSLAPVNPAASPLEIQGEHPAFARALVARWTRATDSPLFLLVAGGIVHLFLDTFMWPYGGGLYWLYPITHAAFRWSFGAWWPSTYEAIMVLAPFFIAAVVVECILVMRKKKL
nr:hypothetical protein [Candidatus Sigynarchaeota archaeon]